MAIKFLTPAQLWQDFDPISEPLDLSVAYSSQDGEANLKGTYFTAVKDGEEQVRAFAEIKSSVAQPKKALLCVLTERDQLALADSFDELLKRGFVVMTVDVSGIPDENGNATKYTSAFSYASYAAGVPDRFSATPSALNSPVFLWAKIVRRAITLLEYYYPKLKVSVMGARTAADVAWQVAAADPRISALLALLGDYSDPPVSADGDSSNADSYTMSLSAKSAARRITCPCLIATCANAHGGDVEKISEVANQMKDGIPFAMTITPRLNDQISESDLFSTYRWLDKTLKGENAPEIKLSSSMSDGKIRFVLSCPIGKAQSASVFLCYNDAAPTYRHWHEFPMKRHEDGSFSVEAPVWEGDREVFAYASIAAPGGSNFASKGIGTLVTSMIPYRVSQFLLDTVSDHGMYADNSRETFLSRESDFAIKEAPDGVPGFWGKGALRTNILSEQGRYEPASSLHISVYSKEDSEIRVCLMKDEDGKVVTYTAVAHAEGAEWTRLSFETDDFKTEELIPMKDWERLLGIILPDTDDKYYNNFLWM